MTHSFQVSQRHKLDNAARRQLLPAADTLGKFNIHRGQTVADIGCGIGYFTLPLARIVDTVGKVYALDISDVMLEDTMTRAAEAGITNVLPLQVKNDKLPLEDGSVDVALLAFLLHELNDLKAMLGEVDRILHGGGNVAIIEWDKKVTSMGPPVTHRLAKEEVINALTSAGFGDVVEIAAEDNFYSLLARKQ